MIEKLQLTDKQREVLANFKKAYQELCLNDIGLVSVESDCTIFAFNTSKVNCFNAPSDAAYDNGKTEIDVTELEEFLPYGMINYFQTESKNTLVAFDD